MKHCLSTIVCVSAICAFSTPLAAQAPRPERPYRGLFGGGVGDVEQSLIWNASTGAGYDDNVFADEGLSSDPRTARAGNFGSFSTGLSYGLNKTRVTFGISGAMSGRYRPDPDDEFYAGYGGSANLSFGLWHGARFTGSQSLGYQPYFVLDLAPSLAVEGVGEAPVDDPGYASVIGDDYLSYSTRLALSQQVSRRGSLGFSFHQQVSDFSSARTDYTIRGGGVGYSHNVGKGLALRLGYGYQESGADTANGVEPIRVHSIDAGLNFNRALSFSRRTTLSFSTGSSGVADASGTRYHLTGSAQLRRELGRTWSAAAGYSRNVQFVDALRRPVLSDGASASLGGLINRRLQFNSTAGVSFAHAGTSGNHEFDTYLASVGIGYALTRYVSIDVNYSFYRYKFAAGAVLPPGFTSEMDRQGIRASLSLWAPIFQRARRSDAAR